MHFNRLLQSTKRSLIVTRQSTQQKLAARAASRKAKQKARDLAKLRSALLISFPSKQEEQARLKTEAKTTRKGEEGRSHAEEGLARIKAEEERQAGQARLRAEEETTRKAEEAHRHEEEAQAKIKAEEERQAEQARLKAEEETTRKAEEAHRHEEEAQARIRAEQERQAEQALFKAEEQARLKAAEERIRKAEEARRHEEAQAGIRAEQERQRTQAEQTGLKAQEESLKDSENKHCPKCKRVVRSDQAYCLYCATRLINETDSTAKPDATSGPLVWLLVIITFLGAGILGRLVINRISNKPSSATSEGIKQSANVKQDPPVVGGTLTGKETILPNPEYPESAKRIGASGKVIVAVLVDRKGTVISARALNGDPLLQVLAVAAAKKARFSPEKLISQRPRTSGTITYNFK